eukprot:gene2056-2243_t
MLTSYILVIIFILLSIHILLISGSPFFKFNGRSIDDVPNPNTDPMACGRDLVSRSSLCDPDKKLTVDEKNEIEGYINQITTAQLAVAIIDKMNTKGLATSEPKLASERFARGLHNRWGVGKEDKNDGILIFLSIQDRLVYISTGNGVESKLSFEVIDQLIQHMRPYLRKEKYGQALISTIIHIDLILSGKGSEIMLKLGRNKATPPHPAESDGEFYATMFLFVAFVVFGGIMHFRSNWRMRRLQRGQDAINQLMKAVDVDGTQGEGGGSKNRQNTYFTSTCPICLEDFPVVEETKKVTTKEVIGKTQKQQSDATTESSGSKVLTTTDENSSAELLDKEQGCENDDNENNELSSPRPPRFVDGPKAPMSLRCGHIFCKACLEEYLRSPEGNKCPICRTPVDDPTQPRPPPSSLTRRPPASSSWSGLFSRSTPSTTLRSNISPYNGGGGGTTAVGTSSATQTMTVDPADPSYAGTGFDQSSPFYRHTPEIRFRLHRMNSLYPDVFTLEMLRTMNSAIDRGSLHDFRYQLNAQQLAVQTTLDEIRRASEQSARNSGMSGSSSSFGGGRSHGGGGGGW